MSIPTRLDKRIKRHVIGRNREYFAATSPGFESLCFEELRSPPLSINTAEISAGGVLFSGRLHDCYRANLHLRTASRILMRIDGFKATNFRTLTKKLVDFPWELYLPTPAEPEYHITARHSRVFHSGAIAERFSASIVNRFAALGDLAGSGQPPPRAPKLFIRLVDDRFTVSLDSSGKHLHKRGLKTQTSAAPVRETTAAAILKLAGYTPSQVLVDPMCGSGTFSIEAAMIAQGIPAGWFREFAFTQWPAFGQTCRRWQHIKSEWQKNITPSSQPLIFASDIARHICRGLEKTILENDLSKSIRVANQDFFDLAPADFTDTTGLVVLNPPYDRRIKTAKGSKNMYRRIWKKLSRNFHGWKFAVIVPRKQLLVDIPFSVQAHPLFHGGLTVSVVVGKVT
jgi:putative N6-adenine-specific DNA methylase